VPGGGELPAIARTEVSARIPTPEERRELARLLDAATERPWSWEQIGEKVNGYVIGVAFTEDGEPIAGRVQEPDFVVDGILVGEHEAATCNYDDPGLIVTAVNALPGLLAALDLAERALIEVVADGERRDHYDTCSRALSEANDCDCGLGIARTALFGLRGEGGS
jgi:hypothetical protein